MFVLLRPRTATLPATALLTLSLAGCSVGLSPLDEAGMSDIARQSLASVAADQEPISGPIDLAEAIARALKYNLDHQVELAEQAVRARELDLSHYSLLPNVVANSGYAARDNVSASSSQNALTGVQSLATSTSQDRHLRTADVAFGWNILDFGLSYVRARQAADKVLIQNELRRKIALRIIEDTRAAYWRALSAQNILHKLGRLDNEARAVERGAGRVAAAQETSAITALTYQREIIDVQRTIGELSRELKIAHAQLGALMNVPPGVQFRVANSQPSRRALASGSLADLFQIALENRPELKEVAYKARINHHESHAAILELLPGLNLTAAAHFDSNSFLLHNHWESWGARASWNLLRVFSYPARHAVIEETDELLKTRALAVTMAVMTQVYVSRIRFGHAKHELDTAERAVSVQRALVTQIRAEAAADRVSRQTLVREELNLLVASARYDLAVAALESAWAQSETSLGRIAHEPSLADVSLRELTERLRKNAHIKLASSGTAPK